MTVERMLSSGEFVSCALISGDELQNRELIGKGGFGHVYEAYHILWGRVAYKRLFEGDHSEQICVKRLITEVRSHYQLRHPNIVQMMAVVDTPDVELGIVMWLEPYGDLNRFMKDFKVPIPWKIRMIYDISLGLAYLHSLNPAVIHADLTLRNVLVGQGFIAKLSDFGLSVLKEYTSLKSRKAHSVFGTVQSIAPEILNDPNQRVNEKTDIYSFAILIWEFITQKKSYPGKSPCEVMNNVKQGNRPQIDEVPKLLQCIITSCWSPEASDRPSCPEIKSQLEKIIEGRKLEIKNAKRFLLQQEMDKYSSHADLCSGNNRNQYSYNPGINDVTNPCCPLAVTSYAEQQENPPVGSSPGCLTALPVLCDNTSMLSSLNLKSDEMRTGDCTTWPDMPPPASECSSQFEAAYGSELWGSSSGINLRSEPIQRPPLEKLQAVVTLPLNQTTEQSETLRTEQQTMEPHMEEKQEFSNSISESISFNQNTISGSRDAAVAGDQLKSRTS